MSQKPKVVPMNCMDMTWLALDTISERIIFHMILIIDGDVDVDKLNNALITVLRRHPALRSVLRRRFLRYYRQLKDDLGPHILEVCDQSDSDHSAVDTGPEQDLFLSEWINRPLDPKSGLPIRAMLLKKANNKYWLCLTFHHYATDALRALRFVNEVINEYNQGYGVATASENAPDQDDLQDHKADELFPLLERPKARVKRYYPKIISSLFYRFVISPFSPTSRIFHDRSGKSGKVSFIRDWMNHIELREIDTKTRVLGATVNDFLLAALFKTIEKWNGLHGKKTGKVTIMVPVDVGRKMSQHIVSNQISYVSPATMPGDRIHHIHLLKKVSQCNGCVIRNGNAFSMIYFTYFVSRLSFAVMRVIGLLFIATRVYIDTTLLTNVGRLRLGDGREPRLGNARIVDICGVTPVISPWGLSLVTGVLEGKLYLGLTYRPSQLSDEKARHFLNLYMEEIRCYKLALQATGT